MTETPYSRSLPSTPGTPTSAGGAEHIRNITRDLIITLLTCGIYNLYIQHRQMVAVNAILKEQKYSFWSWFLLTLGTCGLYHIYHEYRKSSDLVLAMKDLSSNEPIACLVLTMFGLSFVSDAIQQSHINRYYGCTKL